MLNLLPQNMKTNFTNAIAPTFNEIWLDLYNHISYFNCILHLTWGRNQILTYGINLYYVHFKLQVRAYNKKAALQPSFSLSFFFSGRIYSTY